MEPQQILDLMNELKLFGMKAAFDEVLANGLERQHPVQQIIGDLLARRSPRSRHGRSVIRSPRRSCRWQRRWPTSTSAAHQSTRACYAIWPRAASWRSSEVHPELVAVAWGRHGPPRLPVSHKPVALPSRA